MTLRHEEKTCPRCHRAFECKAGSNLIFQCAQVPLSSEDTDYILSRYADCLSADYLEALKAERQNAALSA